jgi:ABC-2 type transport system ATP-binding protein
VLFSSHILSDAELLCSRVGILARGRLVATGTIDDLTRGESQGWEVIASDVRHDLADRIGATARRYRRIADGRFAFELGANARPEPLVADLASGGAAHVPRGRVHARVGETDRRGGHARARPR